MVDELTGRRNAGTLADDEDGGTGVAAAEEGVADAGEGTVSAASVECAVVGGAEAT